MESLEEVEIRRRSLYSLGGCRVGIVKVKVKARLSLHIPK